jgi:hypothetical protein
MTSFEPVTTTFGANGWAIFTYVHGKAIFDEIDVTPVLGDGSTDSAGTQSLFCLCRNADGTPIDDPDVCAQAPFFCALDPHQLQRPAFTETGGVAPGPLQTLWHMITTHVGNAARGTVEDYAARHGSRSPARLEQCRAVLLQVAAWQAGSGALRPRSCRRCGKQPVDKCQLPRRPSRSRARSAARSPMTFVWLHDVRGRFTCNAEIVVDDGGLGLIETLLCCTSRET